MITSAQRNELSKDPIVISVVGPANWGKTSILRTLVDNDWVGQVSANPGATTRVHEHAIRQDGQDMIYVCDTPGFQMSAVIVGRLHDLIKGHLLEEIVQVAHKGGPEFGHDRIAWEQVSRSNVLFFVIDVTQEPGDLFKNDLHLLSKCGRPVVTLLNFVSDDAAQGELLEEWKRILAGHGLHDVAEYDAHSRVFDQEIQLWTFVTQKLKKPLHKRACDDYMSHLEREEKERLTKASEIIAELVFTAYYYCVVVEDVSPHEVEASKTDAREDWKREVCKREDETRNKLVGVWKFQPDILRCPHALDGSLREDAVPDWFGDAALKTVAIGLIGCAAAGAGTGLAVDAALGGMSLGLGALIGAAIGATIGAAAGGGWDIAYDSKRHTVVIRGNAALAELVLRRAIDLVKQLRGRGKAVPDDVKIIVSLAPRPISSGTTKAVLDLIEEVATDKQEHKEAILKIAEKVRSLLD